jgi:hypothetical protein
MKRSGLMVVSAVAALLGFARPAVAEQSASCPPGAGEPYLVCHVDRPPRPDSRNAPPRYPEMLLLAGVSGIVRVRFEQVFDFQAPPNADDPPRETMAIRVDTVSDGAPRMFIGTRGQDSAAAARFTQSDLVDAQRTTLLTLAPAPIADSAGRARVTVCLTMIRDGLRVPGDSATLSALAAPGRRAVVPRDCPRTYASMVYDPMKRAPRGWIDPYPMVVTRLVPWNAETVLIVVEVAQGTEHRSIGVP